MVDVIVFYFLLCSLCHEKQMFSRLWGTISLETGMDSFWFSLEMSADQGKLDGCKWLGKGWFFVPFERCDKSRVKANRNLKWITMRVHRVYVSNDIWGVSFEISKRNSDKNNAKRNFLKMTVSSTYIENVIYLSWV